MPTCKSLGEEWQFEHGISVTIDAEFRLTLQLSENPLGIPPVYCETPIAARDMKHARRLAQELGSRLEAVFDCEVFKNENGRKASQNVGETGEGTSATSLEGWSLSDSDAGRSSL